MIAATWTAEGLPAWVDSIAGKIYRISADCRITEDTP